MSGLAIVLVAVGTVVVVVVALIGTALGRLTTLRCGLENALARVTEELERHHEAVRESAEGLADGERESVVGALGLAQSLLESSSRSFDDPDAIAALRDAEAALDAALEAASAMREEIEISHDRRAFATEAYDEAVHAYEAGRRKPPGALVANLLGYSPALPLGQDVTERSR